MLFRSGYCFATPLGKAIFDNSSCTTKEPVLSRATETQIAEIIKLEQGAGGGFYDVCNVDTSKKSLGLEAMDLRKQLDFQPATDGGTGICIGYLGTDIPLYSAPWVSCPQYRSGPSWRFNHARPPGLEWLELFTNRKRSRMDSCGVV